MRSESKRSRSWSRSRYFQAEVGVAKNSSTPQPCSQPSIVAELKHFRVWAKSVRLFRQDEVCTSGVEYKLARVMRSDGVGAQLVTAAGILQQRLKDNRRSQHRKT